MYRDDLAATHARVNALEAELHGARSQATHDEARIAQMQAELAQLRELVVKLGGRAPESPIYPSRGGAILALGICSLVVCSILGPIAWVMGNTEMRRIRMGEAPREGEGAAAAGRVCGIIGTSILAIVICVVISMVMTVSHHSSHWNY